MNLMNGGEINEFVGNCIRDARTGAKMTQEELAKLLRVSRPSVVNYEAGNQAVSVAQLYKIAIYLKVNVTDLLPSMEQRSNNGV